MAGIYNALLTQEKPGPPKLAHPGKIGSQARRFQTPFAGQLDATVRLHELSTESIGNLYCRPRRQPEITANSRSGPPSQHVIPSPRRLPRPTGGNSRPQTAGKPGKHNKKKPCKKFGRLRSKEEG